MLNWNDIWKIVLSVIAGFGGIGGILVLAIKLSANMITTNLSKKYEFTLNKELESFKAQLNDISKSYELKRNKDLEIFKSQLENKNYVSKIKFDTEFAVYKELNKSFFEMVRNVSWLISSGDDTFFSDDNKREIQDYKIYQDAHDSALKSQDILNSNIPFIASEHYERYGKILRLCNDQLRTYERYTPLVNKELITKANERTDVIQKEYKSLCINIRTYLDSIEIVN